MKKTMAGTIAGLAVAGMAYSQSQRPNILYIFTDQQNAMAMSCAGNPDLKTPHMDRIAREGIRFTNAYCAAPLCTPSRAAMFTGLPPGKLNQLVNGTEIPEQYRKNTLGFLAAEAGYDCAYAGKWHLPGDIRDQEFGFRVLHGHNDIGLAEACAGFLKQKRDKPFFLVASLDNPHNICEYVRDQNIFFAEIEEPHINQCPNLPANFGINPYDAEVIRAEQQAGYKIYPVANYTPDDWRRYRNAYYRLVEAVDAEIGKIVTALEKQGLLEQTVIIFSSDHGDGNAAHQWNQKSALYEETINIPLLVRLPGKRNAGKVLPQLINNGVDLFPTICEFAGAGTPAYCKGKSFKGIAEQGAGSEIREALVTETLFDGSTTKGWAVRTPGYKYVVYDKGKNREQLYDMQTDRGEMVNLAVEENYRQILDQHRKLLVQWHEENGIPKDRRATPQLRNH